MIPLAFAFIISILLNPLVNKLRQKKVPKVASIIIALLVALLVVGGVMFFISTQVAKFSDNMPVLEQKFYQIFQNIQLWLYENYSVSIAKQKAMITETINSLKPYLAQTLGTVLGVLSVIFLLPVYIFLILFYKTLILNFLYEVFAEKNSTHVGDILAQTKTAIQSYMIGLLLEALIVATLNSTALFILGVQYAILLGVIGALLNMLPYIGGIIAIALPMLIATITKDGYSTQLGILIAYLVIQFIDNNFLVLRIVSSKVKINALVSLVVVLLGGALWGLSGMFFIHSFCRYIKNYF